MRISIRYHEIFGQSFVPNLRTHVPHERGYYAVVTNSMGIRSSREYDLHRPAGMRRILVFGDSFTAADGVNNEERFTDIMEKTEKSLEVINFGLPGSGTDQQLLMCEHFGHRFAGDVLLLCILVENINRIASGYRPVIEGSTGHVVAVPKPYFTLEDGELHLHHVPVPRERPSLSEAGKEILANTDFSGKFPKLRDFVNKHFFPLKSTLIKLVRFNPYPQYSSSQHPSWKLMRALLQRYVNKAKTREVVIVPLPTYHYIEGLSKPIYWKRFEEFGREHPNAHIINVLPYFQKLKPAERRNCRFKRDIHYTPLAHRVVANALINELGIRKLI